ncbi:uncharacterized protein N7518_009400 [Penicillium psychrosexuale]|uniref:uncharacterized protein n=1 Tax=Penicillium psychrosexuale TaxID=1002107 RepID=UPI00254508FE|nr:uncharacterized protein N7518_009400 [Penicillium psychrosexuale]KAJ5783723.1 hypothetical protein N7518_009400 [Penicillium psychrosexuale]
MTSRVTTPWHKSAQAPSMEDEGGTESQRGLPSQVLMLSLTFGVAGPSGANGARDCCEHRQGPPGSNLEAVSTIVWTPRGPHCQHMTKQANIPFS